MAVRVTLPSNGAYRLDDLFGVIDFITTEGDVGTQVTTSFFGITGTYEGTALSVSVNGTNFQYGQIGGANVVTSGTVTHIVVNSSLGNFRFDGLNIDMTTFTPTILADINGSAPFGIENYLLGLDWEIRLGNLRDVGWSNTLVGDGLKFNPKGNDTIYGFGGRDKLFTGDGDDFIYGGKGNDRLNGGLGKDVLWGEEGADVIIGGGGNDTINGGLGNDTMTGGKGADKFLFYNNWGRDTIRDFEANNNREKIDLSHVTEIGGWNDLRNNHMTQVNANVVIDDEAGTRVVLLNTVLADLDKVDFIF